MIRDYAVQSGENSVEYVRIEAMVLIKGFTLQQLKSCITDYCAMGVLTMDEEKNCITIV